jgi:hypothetical protein
MLHKALASHHNVPQVALPDEVFDTLLEPVDALERQLALLGLVADNFYARHRDLKPDPDAVALLRQRAWREARVLDEIPSQGTEPPRKPEPLALELEFIAMYW